MPSYETPGPKAPKPYVPARRSAPAALLIRVSEPRRPETVDRGDDPVMSRAWMRLTDRQRASAPRQCRRSRPPPRKSSWVCRRDGPRPARRPVAAPYAELARNAPRAVRRPRRPQTTVEEGGGPAPAVRAEPLRRHGRGSSTPSSGERSWPTRSPASGMPPRRPEVGSQSRGSCPARTPAGRSSAVGRGPHTPRRTPRSWGSTGEARHLRASRRPSGGWPHHLAARLAGGRAEPHLQPGPASTFRRAGPFTLRASIATDLRPADARGPLDVALWTLDHPPSREREAATA